MISTKIRSAKRLNGKLKEEANHARLRIPAIVSFRILLLLYFDPLAPIAYVLIKWRAARNNEPHDRDLGTKVVFHYFQTLAYHVILIGLVLVLFGVLKGSLKEEVKSGLSLIFSGVLIYIIHALVIRKAFKADPIQIVPRFYAGFNLLGLRIRTTLRLSSMRPPNQDDARREVAAETFPAPMRSRLTTTAGPQKES